MKFHVSVFWEGSDRTDGRTYYREILSYISKVASIELDETMAVSSLEQSRTPPHLDGGLKQIFPNFMAVSLTKYGVTIICRYSKDMYFHKIWRV